MLRFAFSPTHDMNIGELRIALLNYKASQQKNESFIVRVEDKDIEKNIEGKESEFLDILALFGVQYTQVIHQSQNVRFHTAMALQLLHEKRAFNCFCSDDWLDKKKKEAEDSGKAYKYDDACRNLPAELVIDNESPFRIRINHPDKEDIDSFIIFDQEKKPTHDFSCAVDDMLNDISMIIDDEKKINTSVKQEHIREQLDYDKKIEFVHVSSMKEQDNLSVKSLLEDGFLPEAISNYLISNFDFDLEVLKRINKEHLINLDAKELSRYVGFADEEIGELARLYLKDVSTTKELKSKIEPIFQTRVIPNVLKEQIEKLTQIIKNAPYFEEYEAFKSYLLKKSELQESEYVQSISILLTNSDKISDVAKVYKYIKNYLGEIIK